MSAGGLHELRTAGVLHHGPYRVDDVGTWLPDWMEREDCRRELFLAAVGPLIHARLDAERARLFAPPAEPDDEAPIETVNLDDALQAGAEADDHDDDQRHDIAARRRG